MSRSVKSCSSFARFFSALRSSFTSSALLAALAFAPFFGFASTSASAQDPLRTAAALKAFIDGGYVEDWNDETDGTALRDVSYGEKRWQKLNIFVPKSVEASKSRCAVLFIHGGSWVSGSRNDEEGFARRMAKHGYLTASVEYMLYNDSLTAEEKKGYSIAAVLDEFDAALAKLKAVGAENGYEVERVALSGISAGGHLTYLYAYTSKARKTSPVEIAFIAPRVGPSEFTREAWGLSEENAGKIAMFVAFMSGTPVSGEEMSNPDEKVLEAMRSISPCYYVKTGAVPTMAAYAGHDQLVPETQREAIVNAFKEINAKPLSEVASTDSETPVFDLLMFPNSDHLLCRDPDCTKKWHELFFQYAERFLHSAAE